MMNAGPEGGMPQFQNPFTDLPRLSKQMGIVLAVSYILSWVSGIVPWLSLVPELVIKRFAVWQFITAGWFETTLLSAIFSIMGVLLTGKYLEPIWGTKEYFKFVTLVNLVTTVATFFLCVVIYLINTTKFGGVFSIPYNGFLGMLCAFTVAGKQIMPNYELTFLFAFKMRAKYVPGAFLLFIVLLGFLTSPRDVPFAVFGTFFGWVYLRFFKENMDGTRGDGDPAFAFSTFFPEALHSACGSVENVFYLLCCKWWKDRRSASSASSITTGTFTLGGSAPTRSGGYQAVPSSEPEADTAEIERRRQNALRAFEARTRGEGQGPTPPV